MPSNAVLNRLAEPAMMRSSVTASLTGTSAQHFDDFNYAANSWKCERRVIVKAEVVIEGNRAARDNPRFVVTTLRAEPEADYTTYKGRGDSETRIKELLLDLEMDRTSCTSFLANQLRVLFTLAAYALYQDLRWQMRDPKRLTVASMRLRLVKIGARVTESVRRIVLHLPAAHPWKDLFLRAARAVGASSG